MRKVNECSTIFDRRFPWPTILPFSGHTEHQKYSKFLDRRSIFLSVNLLRCETPCPWTLQICMRDAAGLRYWVTGLKLLFWCVLKIVWVSSERHISAISIAQEQSVNQYRAFRIATTIVPRAAALPFFFVEPACWMNSTVRFFTLRDTRVLI